LPAIVADLDALSVETAKIDRDLSKILVQLTKS
jgi:hypothetical protein